METSPGECAPGECAHPVRSVRGHARGKDDAALAAELDKGLGRGGGAVPGAEDVELEQPLDLVEGEVEGGLVLGGAGVGHHAVEAALGGHDGVEGRLHALLLGHVAVLELEAAGEPREELLERLPRLRDVQAVDAGRVVGQADLGDAQADALVGAGDFSRCQLLFPYSNLYMDG